MPDYALGTASPTITPDVGSGTWCGDTQTAVFLVYKRMLEAALETGGPTLTLGADAVRHMRHYMNNTGKDLQLDMTAMMAKSSQLSGQFKAELEAAKAFVQTLPQGRHAIRSQRLAQGYFRQRDDRNLFFAIGGYSYWGQGTASVLAHEAGHQRHFALDFEFHFYDRYNWDGGKQVHIAGITVTDTFMQNFHKQCYAREYDVHGTLRQQVRWTVAAPH
jgi:hypothetical protein